MAIGLCIVIASLAVADSALESRSRAPLSEAAEGYAALVGAVETACAWEGCAYGVGLGRAAPDPHPPPEIRALMSRLRLYAVGYDAWTAELWVSGPLWTDPLLYRDPEPTPVQHQTRARREAFERRPTAPDPPPRYAALGGGWYTVQP